jgi:hypothetical protein
MRQITLTLIVLTFILPGLAAAAPVTLPDLVRPDVLLIDGNDMVIAERASISIYSLKDFKLIKKFGRAGDGPQEFRLMPMGLPLTVILSPDHIIVNSLNRISYFTREGDFVKEKKTVTMQMLPFQDKFIGTGVQFEKKFGGAAVVYSFYNDKGEKIKDICANKAPLLRGEGIMLIDFLSQIYPRYKIYGDRIFAAGKQILQIDIYDKNGSALNPAKKDYEKQPLGEEDKKELQKAYEIHPIYKAFWDGIKQSVAIPEYFPPFKDFLIADKKIYVQTFKRKNNKTEFFVFDIDGKYLESVFLPLEFQDVVTPCLYAIDGGKFYQLAENDDEQWDLHITGIK